MKKKKRIAFCFIGKDSDNNKLSHLDGTQSRTYEQKFELICDLTLFHYQLKNDTNDIPRFLRTTACIRKA